MSSQKYQQFSSWKSYAIVCDNEYEGEESLREEII
jgi:hypothetical protein